MDSRQQEAVKAVLESYHVETKTLHEEVATKLAGIRGRINDDIAKQLTPEQQNEIPGDAVAMGCPPQDMGLCPQVAQLGGRGQNHGLGNASDGVRQICGGRNPTRF